MQSNYVFLDSIVFISQNIIVITVENKPGVLNRVTSLLRRRMFNIESLTVAKTADANFSRMTIQLEKDADSTKVSKQLHKLVNVLKVWDYAQEDILLHESLFLRVNATKNNRAEVLQFGEVFSATIASLTEKSITFQYSNTPEKLDEFIETMSSFGIKELVRSGSIAIAKEKR